MDPRVRLYHGATIRALSLLVLAAAGALLSATGVLLAHHWRASLQSITTQLRLSHALESGEGKTSSTIEQAAYARHSSMPLRREAPQPSALLVEDIARGVPQVGAPNKPLDHLHEELISVDALKLTEFTSSAGRVGGQVELLLSLDPTYNATSSWEWLQEVHERLDASLPERGGGGASLTERVAFLNDFCTLYNHSASSTKVAIATTTATGAEGVLREILPWLVYHCTCGITRTYIYYDGTDLHAVALLLSLRFVSVVLSGTLARPEWQAAYEAFGGPNGTCQWAGRPGNYQLMCKQAFNVQHALVEATKDEQTWLLHIDIDELLLPKGFAARDVDTGGAMLSCSIPRALDEVPASTSVARFANHEAVPESMDVQQRFAQVSLFKTALESRKRNITHKFPPPLVNLYANGKAAARLSAKPKWLGPHDFTGKHFNMSESFVLHYAYCRLEDILEKPKRSCPQHLEDARLGRVTEVKQCFILPYDIDVFTVAAQGYRREIEEFFRLRVMKHKTLYQGGPIRPDVVPSLISTGAMCRETLPRNILHGFDQKLLTWVSQKHM